VAATQLPDESFVKVKTPTPPAAVRSVAVGSHELPPPPPNVNFHLVIAPQATITTANNNKIIKIVLSIYLKVI
jgi:hypothetical protein